jgi:hypothetical protein
MIALSNSGRREKRGESSARPLHFPSLEFDREHIGNKYAIRPNEMGDPRFFNDFQRNRQYA